MTPQGPQGSYPPPGQYPQGQASPVNGTMILVMGILSILGCFSLILGPIAMVMGGNGLKTLNQVGDPTNQRGTVNAGRICGIIGTILGVLTLLWYIFAGGLAIISAMSQGKSPTSTTAPAGGNGGAPAGNGGAPGANGGTTGGGSDNGGSPSSTP